MKLIEDEKFDEMQITLIGALIESIKTDLESENLEAQVVKSLLEKISFSTAVILDGSRDAEFDGNEALPFVTFQDFQNEDDEDCDLISSGGGSWMHEYVFSIIKEIYGE